MDVPMSSWFRAVPYALDEIAAAVKASESISKHSDTRTSRVHSFSRTRSPNKLDTTKDELAWLLIN